MTARVRESLAKWRVGNNVPINVYEGDRPICQCHTALDAQRIVSAVNAALLVEMDKAPELAGPAQAGDRSYAPEGGVQESLHPVPACNGPHGDEEDCPVHGEEIRRGRGKAAPAVDKGEPALSGEPFCTCEKPTPMAVSRCFNCYLPLKGEPR